MRTYTVWITRIAILNYQLYGVIPLMQLNSWLQALIGESVEVSLIQFSLLTAIDDNIYRIFCIQCVHVSPDYQHIHAVFWFIDIFKGKRPSYFEINYLTILWMIEY